MPVTHIINGSFLISGDFFYEDPDVCDYAVNPLRCLNKQAFRSRRIFNGGKEPAPDGPGGGYADLRDGTTVVVSDESGTVIATGQLSNGTLRSRGVTFKFTVPDVPDADFYRIEVANRGEVTFAADELEHDGWRVGLSIG